ncbi:FG-GAP-like repeat-containing protein [Tuwongella immobilis]|uniref:Uncharacterized protein n=1 Tax=Tuwongella immobilis TaxID=692036 RepID=A0A6C2YKP6_9BACT|nr:FG-GAP-like repeat-containing protein [Tuwongella immobilis]VIP01683.1 Hemolysin-type calcium-binding region domain protein OS=Rhodopirellula maiorica SM1 GN=RMSM_03614 PE=4 SV=1: VCBS [Tuwongella immobilis]VTR99137.1 Hemolysin-type calcium-binding region domain protein OS=Rhodopirellula maiorica SM1 GN=RMSM_03614 PE=4 SV=1: VCBS [Tuwongella immobilis]
MFEQRSGLPALERTRSRPSLENLEARLAPAVIAADDPQTGVSYTIAPGTVLSPSRQQGVLDNDETTGANFGNPLVATVLTQPAYVTTGGTVIPQNALTLNQDGSFTFVAPQNAAPGVIEFTYTATDTVTLDSDTATVRIIITPEAGPRHAVSAGVGGGPIVRVYNSRTGLEVFSKMAFEDTFRGGVQTATGDLNGDGIDDVVATPNFGGGPVFVIYDGKTGAELFRDLAFSDPNYRGGLSVAIGDVDGDGDNEIILGAGAGGGPRIQVLNPIVNPAVNPFLDTPAILAVLPLGVGSFFAFESTFNGGVQVATGDVQGTGRDAIIVGAGDGGGPLVRVFDFVGLRTIGEFFAFDPSQRSGVSVAAGNFGRGVADIVVGAGIGAPMVNIHALNGALLNQFQAFPQDLPTGAQFLGGPTTNSAGFTGPSGAVLPTAVQPSGLVPFGDGLSAALLNPNTGNFVGSEGGVNVAVTQRDGDGIDDIVTGPGSGSSPRVRIFSGLTFVELENITAFNPNFFGGVFVGGNSGTDSQNRTP